MEVLKKMALVVLLTLPLYAVERGYIGFGVGTDMGSATPNSTGTGWEFGSGTPSILYYPDFAARVNLGGYFIEPNVLFGFGKETDKDDSLSYSSFGFGFGTRAGFPMIDTKRAQFYPFVGFTFQLHKYGTKPTDGNGWNTDYSLMGISLPFGFGLEYFFIKGFSADISLKLPLFEMFTEKGTSTSGGTSTTIHDVSYQNFFQIGLTTFRLSFFLYL